MPPNIQKISECVSLLASNSTALSVERGEILGRSVSVGSSACEAQTPSQIPEVIRILAEREDELRSVDKQELQRAYARLLSESPNAACTQRIHQVFAKAGLARPVAPEEIITETGGNSPQSFVQDLLKPRLLDRSSADWEALRDAYAEADLPQAFRDAAVDFLNTKVEFSGNIEAYGAKAANLMILRQALSSDHVPAFEAFSSQEMTAMIDRALRLKGKSLEGLQKELVAAQGNNSDSPTPLALNKLQEIREEIRWAMARSTEIPPALLQIIEENPQTRFMVRSTAREDTDQLANPGAHLSVVGVGAKSEKLMAAITDVLCSYFDDSSLEQRLILGDQLSEEVFIPVLVQIMVGESQGSEIPVSGVLYTREADGETPELMVSNLTYGHGEGVVDNLAATDTLYLHPEGFDYRLVPKDSRRVADESLGLGGMRSKANPKDMKLRSAIDPEKAKELHEVGKQIHQHYGKPMDIEFVVQSGKVYVVQARPIERSEEAKKPSYLSLDRSFPKEQILKLETVVAGAGQVIRLAAPQDMVVASSLERAFAEFRARQDKGAVKAIIVEGGAETTSHIAGVFRSLQIPVLQTPDRKKIEAWALKGGEQALIDPAKGIAVHWSDARGEAPIREGWGAHPIPAKFSWMMLGDQVTAEIAAFLSEALEKGAQESLRPGAGEELLERLKRSDTPAEGLMALRQLVYLVAVRTNSLMQSGAAGEVDRERMIRQLFLNFAQAAMQAEREMRSDRPIAMKRLYAAKKIEAALSQSPDGKTLHGQSYSSLRAEEKDLARVRASIVKQGVAKERFEQTALLMRFGKLALDTETRGRWELFVLELAKDGSQFEFNSLIRLVLTMQELGVAEEWMNSTFPSFEGYSASAASSSSRLSAQGLLRELLVHFDQNQKAIAQIQGYEALLKDWEERIDAWAEPKEFAKLMEDLQQDLLAPLQSQGFLELLTRDDRDPLVTLAALSFAEHLIDVLDNSLKALCESIAYPESLRIPQLQNFTQLLQLFSQLSQSLIGALPQRFGDKPNQDLVASPGSLVSARNLQTVHDYLAYISKWEKDQIVDYPKQAQRRGDGEFAKEGLGPSGSFSVDAAALGSKTALERSKPSTPGDFHTLSHQNAMIAIAYMHQELSGGIDKLPPEVQAVARAVQESLDNTSAVDAQAKLIATSYNYPLLELTYNLPMRNHSAKVAITVDLSTQPAQTDVKMKVFGHDYMGRMIAAGEITHALGLLYPGIRVQSSPEWDAEAHELRIHVGLLLDDALDKSAALLGGLLTNITELSFTTDMEAEMTKFLQELSSEIDKEGLHRVVQYIRESGSVAMIPYFGKSFMDFGMGEELSSLLSFALEQHQEIGKLENPLNDKFYEQEIRGFHEDNFILSALELLTPEAALSLATQLLNSQNYRGEMLPTQRLAIAFLVKDLNPQLLEAELKNPELLPNKDPSAFAHVFNLLSKKTHADFLIEFFQVQQPYTGMSEGKALLQLLHYPDYANNASYATVYQALLGSCSLDGANERSLVRLPDFYRAAEGANDWPARELVLPALLQQGFYSEIGSAIEYLALLGRNDEAEALLRQVIDAKEEGIAQTPEKEDPFYVSDSSSSSSSDDDDWDALDSDDDSSPIVPEQASPASSSLSKVSRERLSRILSRGNSSFSLVGDDESFTLSLERASSRSSQSSLQRTPRRRGLSSSSSVFDFGGASNASFTLELNIALSRQSSQLDSMSSLNWGDEPEAPPLTTFPRLRTTVLETLLASQEPELEFLKPLIASALH